MSPAPAPRPLPVTLRHADVDRVRTVIRARRSGYAIVSPRRRPPAPRRPSA
jgi:hypothetical protein